MTFDVGVILGLVAQAGALIWGASAISTSVKALSKSVEKLDKTVGHLDDRVDAHEVRLAVVERLQTLSEFSS